MAAGSTYTPIATTTLGSAVNSYTFTSISGSYTDLVLIVRGQFASGADYPVFQFNGDTSSNYSETNLKGNGSVASSGYATSRVFTSPSSFGAGTTEPFMFISNFNNYANTTTYKNVFSRWSNPAQETAATIGLWRSTAAITSIKIYGLTGQTLAVGSNFTLYGILSA
jgi:hypothetical protein